MFVRVKKKPNGKSAVQIVESHRRADKISQKIVRHVGMATNEREIEELKRLAESIIIEIKNSRNPVLPIIKPEQIYGRKKPPHEVDDTVKIKDLREEQRVIDGIGEVFGKLYDDLGLKRILGPFKKYDTWNGILKATVMARLANPASKRHTATELEKDYGIRIPLEKIYRMMDRLDEKEGEVRAKIAQSTFSLFPEGVDLLFFDVTTLYFESFEADDLRNFGFSKDNKFKETQVALALVTTTSGLPITYQLFPGNMYEGHTLIEMIQQIKKVYDVKNVVLVADRGMFNKDNLALMDAEGVKYIVAARLRSLPKKLKEDILESYDFNPTVIENEFHWLKEFPHNSRRLIVSYSAKRAKKDASDRTRLIERLLKKVKKVLIFQ